MSETAVATTERHDPPSLEELGEQLDAARSEWAQISAKRQNRTFDRRIRGYNAAEERYNALVVQYGQASLREQIDAANDDTERNALVISYLCDSQNQLNAETNEITNNMVSRKLGAVVRRIFESGGKWTRTAKDVGTTVAAGAAGALTFGAGWVTAGAARFVKGFSEKEITGLDEVTVEQMRELMADSRGENGHIRFEHAQAAASQLFDRAGKLQQGKKTEAVVRGAKKAAVGAVIGVGIGLAMDLYAPDAAHASESEVHTTIAGLEVADHEANGGVDALSHDAAGDVNVPVSHNTTGALDFVEAHDTTGSVEASSSHVSTGDVDGSTAHEATGTVDAASTDAYQTTEAVDMTSNYTIAGGVDMVSAHEIAGTVDADTSITHETTGDVDIDSTDSVAHETAGTVSGVETNIADTTGSVDVTSNHTTTGQVDTSSTHETTSSVTIETHDTSGAVGAPAAEVDVDSTTLEIPNSYTVSSGEGWYETFGNLGVNEAYTDDLLDKIGPELQELGVAYEMGDSWGIASAGDLNPDAINVIVETAHEEGWLNNTAEIEHNYPVVDHGEGLNEFVQDNYSDTLTHDESMELGAELHEQGFMYHDPSYLGERYGNPYGISGPGVIDAQTDTTIRDMVDNGELDNSAAAVDASSSAEVSQQSAETTAESTNNAETREIAAEANPVVETTDNAEQAQQDAGLDEAAELNSPESLELNAFEQRMLENTLAGNFSNLNSIADRYPELQLDKLAVSLQNEVFSDGSPVVTPGVMGPNVFEYQDRPDGAVLNDSTVQIVNAHLDRVGVPEQYRLTPSASGLANAA